MMKSDKDRLIFICLDEKGIFDISTLRKGISYPPTLSERIEACRLILSGKNSRYKGIRGILLASIHILRNESKSFFRSRQQEPVSLNEIELPELERWAKTMEGLHDRPQCGQDSEETASSSLRSSSSEGKYNILLNFD